MNFTTTLSQVSFSGRNHFRATDRGFHFPAAEEILAADRKQAFEAVCDNLRSIEVKDLLLRQQDMRVFFEKNQATLLIGHDGVPTGESYPVDLDAPFLQQTAADLGIDGQFLRKMLDADTPEWTTAANSVLNLALTQPLKDDQDGDRKRMLRLFANPSGVMEATANMSNGFLRIDNSPLADWINTLSQVTDLVPIHSSFSKGDFVMHAVLPIPRNVALLGQPQDDLFFGITVRNSMTGGSKLYVQCFLFRRTCRNGMMHMVEAAGLARAHRGRRQSTVGELVMSRMEREAVTNILHDARRNALRLLQPDVIEGQVVSMQQAQSESNTFAQSLSMSMVEANPVAKALAKDLNTSQEDAKLILTNLFTNPAGGLQSIDMGFNKWGLVNAITAAAHGQKPAKAQELMALGGNVLDWEPRRFKHTAEGLFTAFAR